MKDKYGHFIGFRVPDNVYESLKDEAAKRGVTPSRVARDAFLKGLSNHEYIRDRILFEMYIMIKALHNKEPDSFWDELDKAGKESVADLHEHLKKKPVRA